MIHPAATPTFAKSGATLKGCQQPAFTISRIADALGLSRSAVGERLAAIRPDRQAIVAGNYTHAWYFSSLSADLQQALEARAEALGYRDAISLLSRPSEPWQPPVPWTHCKPADQTDAFDLRSVLRPFLALKFSKLGDGRSRSQWEAAAIAAYQSIFKREVSGRWLRALFKRTIERDREFQDWDRVELYLPDKLAHITPAAPLQPSRFDHAPLADRLHFKDPLFPTLTERQNALEYSFGHFEALAAAHPNQRLEIKRSILQLLHSAAPSLAASPAALRRTWDRKYSLWQADGRTPAAIKDRRADKSVGAHLDGLASDLDLITAESWRHDGKLSLAIRKLRKAGKLSADFLNRYILDVRRDKSHVARSIRAEIKSRLEGTLAYRRGPRAIRDSAPHIARDHSGYLPGQVFAADDVSFNILWWVDGPDGRPKICRGEVLLWFDCRSLYPLSYIITDGHYNGETVRLGQYQVHQKHGLPKTFIYEKGVWASRLVDGPKALSPWSDYEIGLRSLNVEIRHAATPTGKLIEGVFNIAQQSQRDICGFVGFDERRFGQELLQRFKGRVARGLVHPSEKLLSLDQWNKALSESLDNYASEPQNGRLLQGQSPSEMWANHVPLRKLRPEELYRLSTHCQRVRVKSNGIAITIRGQRRFYFNPEIAEAGFVGRDVLAYYNILEPDLLTVSDLKREHFVSVRHLVLPAFSATKEQLAYAYSQRAGFTRPAKLRVDQMKHAAGAQPETLRSGDDNSRQLGTHILLETERHRAQKAEESTQLRRLDRAAEEAGIALPESIRHPERCQRGIELLKESAEAIREQFTDSPTVAGQAGAAAPSSVKTYVLHDPPPSAQPTPAAYWALWAKIEKIKPGLSRHALTRKALHCAGGPNPSPKDMTTEQLAKMIDVFTAILRDAKETAL